MEKSNLKNNIPMIRSDVLVIGSGTASLNAAIHLKRGGADVIVVTEHPGWGTSANTGSDKQTYYKADPGGCRGDSFVEMARQLYRGGAMHGDIALIEASLSQFCFHHLAALGVPFPQNTYGNFPGYRTDHDTRNRGTSAGPRTSIMMYQALLEEVKRLSVPIFERHEIIEIITDENNRCTGAVALDKTSFENENYGVTIFSSKHTVLGTGGPGALFRRSVYPHQQKGSLGLALKTGAPAQNLTESQFGIGSVKFRWNLSGSYQQILPRYYSVDESGNEYSFLENCFPSPEKMFLAQFQKGYMWPFDIKKCRNGSSSVIDMFVYRETVLKGRRVYLDFRQNPSWRGIPLQLDKLPAEVYTYLKQSGALQNTPIERLQAMNLPAYELYKNNGIDLALEPLEIAVNHQHCNGGLRGSIWWESEVRSLFPVGEINGTHGIYRPGGSALNAGQVGSYRASQQILWRLQSEESMGEVEGDLPEKKGEAWRERIYRLLDSPQKRELAGDRSEIRNRSDRSLGIIRNRKNIEEALGENRLMAGEYRNSGINSIGELLYFLKNEDLLLTEYVMLHATVETLDKVTGGRGSWFVGTQEEIFQRGSDGEMALQIPPSEEKSEDVILESRLCPDGSVSHEWVRVRPVPEEEEWFEEIWSRFRDGRIYKDTES